MDVEPADRDLINLLAARAGTRDCTHGPAVGGGKWFTPPQEWPAVLSTPRRGTGNTHSIGVRVRRALLIGLFIVAVLGALFVTARGGANDTVAVGPAGSVAADWVDGVPVWVKADERGDVTLFDAVNPHPIYGLDELVGWCASSGWFQAWWDGSRFDGDGKYAFGPAPHDLVRYQSQVLDGGRVRVKGRVTPEGRSHTDDEPDGPHCHGDGGRSSAEFHPVDGSQRELFEGAVIPGQDGVARFCADEGVPPSCPDDSPSVPQAVALGDRGITGSFLAREQDGVLVDVIYLPEDYAATQKDE